MGTASRRRATRLVACAALVAFAGPAGASPGPNEMDLAVQNLDADHDHATAAAFALQAGGAAAAEAIRDAWPSLSTRSRKRALHVLRSLAERHAAAVEALVEAARSVEADVHQQAFTALRACGQPCIDGVVALLSDARVGDRAASLLARTKPDFAVGLLLDALAKDGGPDRQGVRAALAVAVKEARQPKPTLAAWLEKEPPHAAVASAAMGLSALRGHSDVLASYVTYAMPGSNDFPTAWRLLRTAGAAAPNAEIDRWVRGQLTASEWMLRAAAVDAVTARNRREEARPCLGDSSPRVRVQAAKSLSGDPSTLIERAALARKDTWPMVRAAAVTSLRHEQDALPVIIASVDDSMSIVRAAAIEVLTAAPHDRGWPRIHGRLRDPSEWSTVTAAAIGYAAAHCRSDAAESLFRVVVRAASSNAGTEDLNNAARAIEALRALGTPEAQATIGQLRVTPGVPPTLKMALSRPLAEGSACSLTAP